MLPRFVGERGADGFVACRTTYRLGFLHACIACMTGGLDPQPTGGLGLEWAAVNEGSVGKCARLGIPADLVLQWLVRCGGRVVIPTTALKVTTKHKE